MFFAIFKKTFVTFKNFLETFRNFLETFKNFLETFSNFLVIFRNFYENLRNYILMEEFVSAYIWGPGNMRKYLKRLINITILKYA